MSCFISDCWIIQSKILKEDVRERVVEKIKQSIQSKLNIVQTCLNPKRVSKSVNILCILTRRDLLCQRM